VNLLLQTKRDAEIHFGKSATMAPNLLGMIGQGERSFGFLTGDMSQGFEITLGLFNDKARYLAFQKRSGTPWGEGDLRSALMQIGDYSNWSVKTGSDFFDYVEKAGKEIVAEASGWQTPHRRYVFIYVPNVSGEIGIIPDKTAIDRRFSFS
jgi:hypothetical protein